MKAKFSKWYLLHTSICAQWGKPGGNVCVYRVGFRRMKGAINSRHLGSPSEGVASGCLRCTFGNSLTITSELISKVTRIQNTASFINQNQHPWIVPGSHTEGLGPSGAQCVSPCAQFPAQLQLQHNHHILASSSFPLIALHCYWEWPHGRHWAVIQLRDLMIRYHSGP